MIIQNLARSSNITI